MKSMNNSKLEWLCVGQYSKSFLHYHVTTTKITRLSKRANTVKKFD
jgi:hypothetical protein